MIRNRIASAEQPAGRPLIPSSVQLRVRLAIITIMLPFLILLSIALYGEYCSARLLQGNGHPGLLAGAANRIAVVATLALLWMAIVLLITIRTVENRVLRPLRHLTSVALHLAEGELDSRVEMSRIRMIDMRRLAATVNVMAEILEKLALTDSLTSVANRRQFDAVIAGEVKRSTRMKKGLALLIVDVDKFKDFNDLYGHGAGDLCLRRIAEALQVTVRRPSDLVARYGGEEFVVLLPDTDAAGAHAVASELLAAVRGLEIAHAAWERGIVTISIGLAVSSPQSAIDTGRLVERADQALYAAKLAGRDRALMSETMSVAA
jgi:diguanylate cyclase (GGDEF)-like protein